jgi:hypothetical protein
LTPAAVATHGAALARRIAADEARCSVAVAAIQQEAWVTVSTVTQKLELWTLNREAVQDTAKALVRGCSLAHSDPSFHPVSKRIPEALEAAEGIKKPKQYTGNAREQKTHREAQKCVVVRGVVEQWAVDLTAHQQAWQREYMSRTDSVVQALAKVSTPLWRMLDAIRARLETVAPGHPRHADMASAVGAAAVAIESATRELDSVATRLDQLAADTFARVMEDVPSFTARMVAAGDSFDDLVAVLRELKDRIARVESKVEKKCRSECVKQLIAVTNSPQLLASAIALLRAAVSIEVEIETRDQSANVAEVDRLRAE